jgi:hypothetical protein
MRPVAIVTLSKYPEIFDSFQENINTFLPGIDRVLVKDGYLIDTESGWYTIQGPPGKFVYSVNANLGLKAVDPAADIFLIGDDVRLKDLQVLERLQALSDTNGKIGMLSPKILGGADNVLQTNPPIEHDVTYSDRYLALVATYIKREVVDSVGFLDEAFSEGWGWDDVDYSRRVRQAGFLLGVTPRVEVIHGLRKKGSESLIKNEKGDSKAMQKQDEINALKYFEKWGDNVK